MLSNKMAENAAAHIVVTGQKTGPYAAFHGAAAANMLQDDVETARGRLARGDQEEEGRRRLARITCIAVAICHHEPMHHCS